MAPLWLMKIWNIVNIIRYFCLMTMNWSLIALFCGPREAFYAGSLEALRRLRIQVALTGKLKNDVSSFKGVILSTHKGWSDFYTLPALDFSSCVSRMILAFVLPGAGLCAHLGGCLLLFRRSGGPSRDVNVAQKKVEEMANRYVNWIKNVNERLLVYPEGHRNGQRGLLKMRSGTFRIAFEKKIPCLIAPAEGSEFILNEKKGFFHPTNIDLSRVFADKELKVYAPQNIVDDNGYRISKDENEKDPTLVAQIEGRRYRGFFLYNVQEIVDPADYNTFEAFQTRCEEAFKSGYESVCKRFDELVEGTTTKDDTIVFG